MTTELLATLKDGTEIFKGNLIYRHKHKKVVIAESVYKDYDGDKFLCFKDGGNAWFEGPSDIDIHFDVLKTASKVRLNDIMNEIWKANEHWKRCQDGSFELAIDVDGYWKVKEQFNKTKGE